MAEITLKGSQCNHIPVLFVPLLAAVSPVSGRWLDGTFGAGGYSRGLLEAGVDHVIAIDRDPQAFEMAKSWEGFYGDRLTLVKAVFSQMDIHAKGMDGVVLDLGVSSMQIDCAERGFSFMQDGPLDMRMSQSGQSAADLVNAGTESDLADILFYYGEERASRRIAKAVVAARRTAPITGTLALAQIIQSCLPRPKPGHSHPATRSFQALRIAVNDEYGELFSGLLAAERALKPGGILAVVSFHSIEDRMVKRFMRARAGKFGSGSRYAPEIVAPEPRFELLTRKAITANSEEVAQNPRARSALLRIARRTNTEPGMRPSKRSLGMPQIGRTS
ncbi:MAG: 16S rRNA (cytosine(1402)-N(4))-methyltransferase RsmH [Paracoccaceae bacterium]|nr:16S rRNA (cytosine(1402)-N(4))-methyltransferase RsmH [Paracoccaceae bacterium]